MNEDNKLVVPEEDDVDWETEAEGNVDLDQGFEEGGSEDGET